jgi:hypothetical protein
MVLPYCFIAGTTGLLSVLGLWPFIGPMSLLAAPFIASTAALAAGGILASRQHALNGQTAAARRIAANAAGLL